MHEGLERRPEKETINGIAKGKQIPLVGAVVLWVRLGPRQGGGPVVPIRCKVLKTGTSGWQGMILSARTLDVVAKGGLGMRVLPEGISFDAKGVVLPRLEWSEEREGRSASVQSVVWALRALGRG